MKSIHLSPRQAQVVSLLAQGYQQKEIARKLFISQHTVEHHIETAKRQNQTRNCVDLCVYAALQGKLDLTGAAQ